MKFTSWIHIHRRENSNGIPLRFDASGHGQADSHHYAHRPWVPVMSALTEPGAAPARVAN